MTFKAIGFDYGGVIAGISSAEFYNRVINFLNVDPKIFKEVYYKFNKLVNTNILTPNDFWKKILEELNVINKHDELMKFIQGLPFEIDEQVLGLVDQLKTNGYKVGLLSNNTLDAAKQFRDTGFTDHFDVTLVSAEIGFSKPDPKAFEIFAERLGVSLSELIFIDDTERSLSTAKQVGFKPILFTSYEALLIDLKVLGVRI